MVVAMHAELSPLHLFPWLRISVPLFFIMTSYFLFRKIHCFPIAQQKQQIRNFILRNAKLYGFWFLVLLPFTLLYRKQAYFLQGAAVGLSVFLMDLLFRSTFSSSWYITASVVAVIMIWWLSRKEHGAAACGIAVFAFIMATLWSSYQSDIWSDSLLFRILYGYARIFENPAVSFPIALIWILIGKAFAENRITASSNLVVLTAAMFSAIGLYLEWWFVRNLNGTYRNDSYFMLIPLCILLFAIVQKIPPFYIRSSRYLKQLSTVIYTSHYSFLPVIRILLKKLLHFDSNMLVFSVTLFCCCLLYGLIKFIQHTWPNSKVSVLLKSAY